MTPIADMVEKMLLDGATHEEIVAAVRALEPRLVPNRRRRCGGDAMMEKRRAYDRQRKALLPSNWTEITSEVFVRDSFTCVYCGDRLAPLHCDHVIPLSRGGASQPDNLVTACQDCNLDKGARTPEEWRQ